MISGHGRQKHHQTESQLLYFQPEQTDTICELGATQWLLRLTLNLIIRTTPRSQQPSIQYAIEMLVDRSRTFSVLARPLVFIRSWRIDNPDKDGDLFAEWSRYHVVTNTGGVEPPLVFKNKARKRSSMAKQFQLYQC